MKSTIETLAKLEAAPSTHGMIRLSGLALDNAALGRLAQAGVIELRPESGIGVKLDRSLPKAFDGTPLAYARLLG